MAEPRYYSSPVDYEAWRKGYMPPSEHVLIHKLSVGDVRVLASSNVGKTGWWLVAEGGKRPTPAQRKAIRMIFEMWDEDDEEESRTVSAQKQPAQAEPGLNETGTVGV